MTDEMGHAAPFIRAARGHSGGGYMRHGCDMMEGQGLMIAFGSVRLCGQSFH